MAEQDLERRARDGVFDAGRGLDRRERRDLGHVRGPAREVPVFATTDVLVVGGGPAGTTAAIAAARVGADVILAERYNQLGGLSTGGLGIWIDRMSGWDGNLLIRGLAEELMDRKVGTDHQGFGGEARVTRHALVPHGPPRRARVRAPCRGGPA